MKIFVNSVLTLMILVVAVTSTFGGECLPADSFLHLLKESRLTSQDILTPQFIKKTFDFPWLVEPCRSGCSSIMIFPSPSSNKDCQLYLTFYRKGSQEVLYRMEVYFADTSFNKTWKLAESSLKSLSPIVPQGALAAFPFTVPESSNDDGYEFAYSWRGPEFVDHEVKVQESVAGRIFYSKDSSQWVLTLHIIYEGK